MSSTEAEKTTIGTSDLSHKYSGPEDTIEKGDPPKLLKENFPSFLSARVSRDLASQWCSGPGTAEDALLWDLGQVTLFL